MRILKTSETPEGLRLKAASGMSKVAGPDEKDPPVGMLAIAGEAPELTGQAKLHAIFGAPIQSKEGSETFMDSRGVKLTRGIWDQIKSAVPTHLQQGVQAAWIVLDASALLSKYNALPPDTENEHYIELAIDAAELGLKGLSLAYTASGKPDSAAELEDIGVLLKFGQNVADGKDFTLLAAQDLLEENVEIYKVGKSYLDLLETALGRKDLVSQAGNWILNTDRPNYYATIDPSMAAALRTPPGQESI